MTFDIIIMGAGITGLTLAAALADEDCTIAIIDQHPKPDLPLTANFDLRVSAINHASTSIFQSLGLWEDMKHMRVSPYEKMQVWDANGPAHIDFDCTEVGQACLGYIVENSVMKMALLKLLEQKTHIQFFHGAAKHIWEQVDKITVTLENGESFMGRLLVGADGSHSWVAKNTGLDVKTQSYQHSALVATVATEQAHQRTAWQRFLSSGPLAFLPLSDAHHCSIVWSTSPEQALALQNLSVAEFNQALTEAFEYKLGKVNLDSDRLIFPLQQRHARRYIKSRVALIGDAAHSIHPLAGQGLNLGLLDAACLAEVISHALHQQADFASWHCLRRYERWRKGENQFMLSAVGGLKNLFAHARLSGLRHLGFTLTEKLPLIKSYLSERAMGLRGDLPKRALRGSSLDI